jgi:hypothetical protein
MVWAKGLDQFVGPAEHLRRGTHDEEHGWVTGMAGMLGPDLQSGRIDKFLIAIQYGPRLMCASIFI